MRLKGKVAIVTGAASGIGRAVAEGFAREGAAVAVADIDAAGGAETAAGIVSAGGRSIFIQTDVRSKEQTDRMAEAAVREFGTIDILVTSAGVLEDHPIENTTDEQWQRVIGTNLSGVLFSTQSVLPEMQRKNSGKIVIITSIAGLRGRTAQHAYCAAEGSLIGFAANTAVQVSPQGINVNAIAAGIIDTDFPESLKDQPEYREFRRSNTPLRRIGKPEDIIGPAVFFASSDSDFITGETLVVDGGISIYTNGYGL